MELFLPKKELWIAPKATYFQNEYQSAADTGLSDMDEYRELRSFQAGDALQWISWKQAAQGQGLYVKQFEEQHDLNIIHIEYEKMPSSEHEEKLSLMMGLVERCEQLQVQYTLSIKNLKLNKAMGVSINIRLNCYWRRLKDEFITSSPYFTELKFNWASADYFLSSVYQYYFSIDARSFVLAFKYFKSSQHTYFLKCL